MKHFKFAVAVAAVGLSLTFANIGIAAPGKVDGFDGNKITSVNPGWVGGLVARARTPGWVG